MQDPVEPLELCLESMDPREDDQPYVRCVAISGAELGLGISADGDIVWRRNEDAAALLWVSTDNQLMLERSQESLAVRLCRAERFLDLPLAKPVVVLNEDHITLAGYTLRVHIHGVAAVIEPPARLPLRRVQSMIAGAAIAAVSMAGCHAKSAGGLDASAVVASSATLQPSGMASSTLEPRGTGGAESRDAAVHEGTTQTGGTTSVVHTKTPVRPIEVRQHPPKPALPQDRP